MNELVAKYLSKQDHTVGCITQALNGKRHGNVFCTCGLAAARACLGLPHSPVNWLPLPEELAQMEMKRVPRKPGTVTLYTHQQMGKLTTPNLLKYRDKLYTVPVFERSLTWGKTLNDCRGILTFRGVSVTK